MSFNQIKKVDKPWGYELWWAVTDKYVGKILSIDKDHTLSLQYHEVKDETLFLQEGELLLELHTDTGEIQTLNFLPGQSVRIKPNTKHRLRALKDSQVFEVSTPEIEDVIRLKDDYGRI
ncbi:MAG: cupin [Candidatus Dadabacteria bacterium]|nr:cupin [Candidatus Dadabacteria bacterium]NIT13627.1 cupin [Candidatus Dadabacteria bacterium]